MSASPEFKNDTGVSEAVKEHSEEFIVPETLQQSTGVKVVQKNFKAQVMNDKGQAVIQIPPVQVISVTPPASSSTLLSWSKGSISSSLTWLAAFWLRIIKKAIHFGWKVNQSPSQNSNQ